MGGDGYIWPNGFQSAACFTLDLDAHAPHLWMHRRTMPSLLSHLEQRRFGPRVGIHRILDLLDRFALKGTFFVPGVVAEDHPDLLPLPRGEGRRGGPARVFPRAGERHLRCRLHARS